MAKIDLYNATGALEADFTKILKETFTEFSQNENMSDRTLYLLFRRKIKTGLRTWENVPDSVVEND